MTEDRFGDFIGPMALMAQVRSAVPWIARLEAPPAPPGTRPSAVATGAMGWLSALRAATAVAATARPDPEERFDYACLCFAAHHATVASFVPTDVDSKIRGHAWHDEPDAARRGRLLDLALAATRWDVRPVSRRWVIAAGRTVSGHDGEWLGVIAGALGAALTHRDEPAAERCVAALDEELAREAQAFTAALATPGLDALRLAAVLTHNAGDLDQGLSYWRAILPTHPLRARYARLAHEGGDRHGGAFLRAAAIYKRVLAAEGHRNYPLREAKALRRDPDLLLPFAPLLDDWGRTLATHEALSGGDRDEILTTLVVGCRKVRGQAGYYRAIAGFVDAAGGADRAGRRLASGARKALDDPGLRKLIAVAQGSFESSLVKRMQQALTETR
ncbi:MAG TPA: hypothetical protein VEL07_18740 [Planctomycetota bacterium]|nr:hypothetical protein [Planctomycetota bacterium]